MEAAVMLGTARPSDVIVKIRQEVLNSEHPACINYMRGSEALSQTYSRYCTKIQISLWELNYCNIYFAKDGSQHGYFVPLEIKYIMFNDTNDVAT
jgi:hypothetical protein